MSTFQRMTLIGMYNYDSTLFDSVTLPTGYDKNKFIEALLLEHGEKCVQYTDVDFMKFSLGAVSRKWALELEKIYDALTADYDPISNYDRHEEWEDHSGVTYGRTDTNEQLTDASNERKVSAYNSSTYEADSKVTVNNGKSKNTQGGSDKSNSSHKGHIYGNIGVMTAASMVTEVVKQRKEMNLYDVASRIFANELLIQLY